MSKHTDKYGVEYNLVHQWIRRHYSKSGDCENPDCQTKHPKRLEWALKKGYSYERKRENFITLCASCHRKYDVTDDTRAKLSKMMTERVVSEETRIKHHLNKVGKKPAFVLMAKYGKPCKSVTRISTGEVFSSMNETVRKTGITMSKIFTMVHSKKKVHDFVFTSKLSTNG